MKTQTFQIRRSGSSSSGKSGGSGRHGSPSKGVTANTPGYTQITCGHCGAIYLVADDGHEEDGLGHDCWGRPCCPTHYERIGEPIA